MNNLARLYIQQDRYSEAEPLCKLALKIRETILGENHLDTANSMDNLAMLYATKKMKYKKLFVYFSPLDNQMTIDASFERNIKGELRSLFESKGSIDKSQEKFHLAKFRPDLLCARVLAIRVKVLGKEHPDTATSLNNLAKIYTCRKTIYLNQFSQQIERGKLYHGHAFDAEPLYKRALIIREKVLGKEHPHTAEVLDNLAKFYVSRGQHSKAENFYRKALHIREKVLRREHPEIAENLNGLADLYFEQSRYSDAERLYKKAIIINDKVFSGKNMDICSSFNNLSMIYIIEGRYSEAEQLLRRVLTIEERTLGKDNPHIATSLNNLAIICDFQGKYSDAKIFYKRLSGMFEKVRGKEYLARLNSQLKIAILNTKTGKWERAFSVLHEIININENKIFDRFKISTEKEKFKVMAVFQANYEVFLSLIIKELQKKSDFIIAGFNAVLRRKGIVLEALMGEREALMESGSPEAQKVYKELYQVTSLISSLTLAGPGKMSMELYRKRLRGLESEREKLEKELTSLSKEYASEKRTRSADCESVSRKLPGGSVLMEYVNIRPFNFKAKGKEKKWGEPEYFAFILPSARDLPKGKAVCPKLVSLGKASVIDEAVKEFRKEIVRTRKLWENRILDESAAEKRLAKKGRRLYELVIAPIRKAIGEKKTLYIAPDGDLNLIPFDALQDETGHYLIEKYKLKYISSGRDLLRWEGKVTAGNETLIIADPDYDMSGSDRASAAKRILSKGKKVAIRGGSRSTDLTMVKWNRLPGTRKEAEEIKKIFRGEKMLEYLDKSALEKVVKGIKSPHRLHIATHGFFLEDRDDTILLKSGIQGNIMMDSRGGAFGRIPIKMENPLLRSGLVFAGANRLGREKLPEGCEDGILTALEISGINLRGTDLVVLSACDTGVGKTRRGEGVFGLRRAFQLAGAKTVVMSLWSVPDKQTQELMVDYYGRIKNGEGKSKALRNTMLSIIKERRKKTGASHPFFWASFISVGEP
ncbi:MAG: CHAT domain-containing protein [Candidatus Eremiobacteraeota bacterium]|nr:CHAT domain-containing protein [Candidatus Eremiobacteraeota bacterium]